MLYKCGKKWKNLLAPQLHFSLAGPRDLLASFSPQPPQGKLIKFSSRFPLARVGLSGKFTSDTCGGRLRAAFAVRGMPMRSQHVVRCGSHAEVTGYAPRKKTRGPSASTCTQRRYHHRGGGFPGKAGPAPGLQRPRGRPLFYCSTADHPAPG